MGSRKNTSAATRFRPTVAALEDRTAPAAHTWITNGAGLWSDPANWAGNDVPDSAEAAPITVNFATTAVVNVAGVDPNLQLDGILFSAGGTILNLNAPLRLRATNQVETITANATGVQINGPAALTFLGNGVTHDLLVGAGNTLVVNAPVAGAAGINKTGDGLVRLAGDNTLGGEFRVLDGTTALAGTTDLASVRVGDGNLNLGTANLVIVADASPSVGTLRVDGDGVATINAGATLDADTVSLGSSEGGGTVTGPGQLRLGAFGSGISLNPSTSASVISSGFAVSSPFSPTVAVPDVVNGVDLIVSGAVGGANGFTKDGAGTMRLGGAAFNTLTDTIRVASGTLEVGGAAGVTAVAGNLDVVGLLDQPPAVVRQLFSNVIANTADVTVGFLGTYNLNSLVESIDRLTVQDGGGVQVGNGVLSTQGDISLNDGDITMTATGILIPAQNVIAAGNAATSQITGGRIDLTGGRTANTTGTAILTIFSSLVDGTLAKVGPGELQLFGMAAEAATVNASAGTLTVAGARPATDINLSGTAFLRGNGGVADVAMTGASSFQPGDSQGNVFAVTSLDTNLAGKLVYSVFSDTVSNRLVSSGPVDITGSPLQFFSLADVPVGTAFTFINKTSPGAVVGTFLGLPEGETFADAGQTYRISYVGGDGNDVTATRVLATTTVLVPSLTSAPVGEAVGVAVTVTAQDNSIPTGTVRFFVDEVAVGEAQLDANGQASLVLPFLPAGARLLSAAFVGTTTFGNSNTLPVFVTVESAASALAGPFAAGAGEGGKVRVFNADGTEKSSLTPFAGFAGSVRTAVADFTGDGVADVAVAAGPGSTPRIQVIDGKTNEVILDKLAFEAAFTGGVYVAAGDLDGDDKADLVVTPDEGGGPRVTVLRGGDFTQLANFFGIDDSSFRGGARASVGDINRDGRADLIVSAGFGGGPRVAGFDGRTISSTPAKLFNDFFVFEQALRNGAFVTVGDLNGDGFGDLIGGGGPGGGPRVLAFSGEDVIASKGDQSAVLANFFAGNVENRGGVRVAAKDLDGDVFADLVVGDGTGAGSRVTGYLGTALGGGSPAAAFAFDGFAGSLGGVFVG